MLFRIERDLSCLQGTKLVLSKALTKSLIIHSQNETVMCINTHYRERVRLRR